MRKRVKPQKRVRENTEAGKNRKRSSRERRKRRRRRERLAALAVAALLALAAAGGCIIGIFYVLKRKGQESVEESEEIAASGETGEETEREREGEEKAGYPVPVMTQGEFGGLPYCLFVPSVMETGQSYPVVLSLHGAGERGSDNQLQLNDTGIVPFLTEEEFYAQNPCIILAPQCPEGEQWVDTPWEDGSYSIEEVPISEELQAAAGLLEEICREYPVDESRVYMAGVSMGGYGAWDMLMRSPDLFAGAVILCGAGDPSQAEKIKEIPIWVFHGAEDEEVPVSGSREMVEALEEAGAETIRYTEYENIGHWIWMVAYEEEGLLDWLFAQRRK